MFQSEVFLLVHLLQLVICISWNESSYTLLEPRLRPVQMALQTQKGIMSAAKDNAL